MVRIHPRERTAAADRKGRRGVAGHDDLPRSGHGEANQQARQSAGVDSVAPSSAASCRRRYLPGQSLEEIMVNPSLPEHLHHVLMRHVVETGHAPDPTTLASLAKLSPQETEHALRQLSEMNGVVLLPSL